MASHRLRSWPAAALPVFLALACENQGSSPTTVTPRPASPAPAITVTPAPDPTPTLYSWANPISGVGNLVDHTWVTSFPAASQCPPPQNYWYSWGGCHETGPGTTAKPLATHAANLAVARCICAPDVGEYLPPDSPSHGGINLYGIDGVCHQLSNRILWAATLGSGAPVTVDGAKGYGVSRWLYGTYGGNVADWQQRVAHCVAASAPAPTAAAGTPVAAMAMMARVPQTLDADLAAMIREKLGPEFPADRAARLVQIRRGVLEAKTALDRRVQSGQIPPRQFAESVNELVNRGLRDAAEVLTPNQYEKLFGVAPGERIGVVDPAIAEKSRYRRE